MKIKDLVIDGFSSHVHTSMKFERPVAMIVGPLNAGKSSIAQAIEFALIGECGYYRKRTDARIELIHDLTDTGAMTVDLEWEKGHVRRSRTVENVDLCEWNGQTAQPAAAEAAVTGALGVSKSILSAALNTADFFNLDHATQKELIIGLIGAEVTNAKVRALFTGEAEALKLLKGDIDSIQALDNAYQYVFDRRTIVKRDKTNLKPAPAPDGPAPPLDKIKARIEQLDGELQTAIADKARFEGAASVVSMRDEMNRRRAVLAAVQHGPLPEQIERLQAEFDKAKKKQEESAKTAGTANQRVTELKTTIQLEETALAKLSKFDGKCVFADVACSATPAAIESAKSKATQSIHSLMDQLEKAERTHRELQAQAGDFGLSARPEADLKTAKAAVNAHALAQTDIAAIDQSLSKLEAVSVDTEKVRQLEETIRDIRERLAVGRTKLSEAQSWIERARQVNEVAEKRKAVETELRHLESLCDFLGPKGVKVTLIDERIGRFEEAINRHLGVFGYSLKIQPEPWKIIARGRSLNRLSASERFRLGISFQIAIARLTGLNFVICDGTEILPQQDFGMMMSMLFAAELDQAIVIRTLQVPVEKFMNSHPSVPQLEYFVVSNTDGRSTVEKFV